MEGGGRGAFGGYDYWLFIFACVHVVCMAFWYIIN